MKKNKLNLEALKVNSFVTNTTGNNDKTKEVKGGTAHDSFINCLSLNAPCATLSTCAPNFCICDGAGSALC